MLSHTDQIVFGLLIRLPCLHMPFCGSTMCNWLTVNQALDLILVRGPEEAENTESKNARQQEANDRCISSAWHVRREEVHFKETTRRFKSESRSGVTWSLGSSNFSGQCSFPLSLTLMSSQTGSRLGGGLRCFLQLLSLTCLFWWLELKSNWTTGIELIGNEAHSGAATTPGHPQIHTWSAWSYNVSPV